MPDVAVVERNDREATGLPPKPGENSRLCSGERDSDLDSMTREIRMQKEGFRFRQHDQRDSNAEGDIFESGLPEINTIKREFCATRFWVKKRESYASSSSPKHPFFSVEVHRVEKGVWHLLSSCVENDWRMCSVALPPVNGCNCLGGTSADCLGGKEDGSCQSSAERSWHVAFFLGTAKPTVSGLFQAWLHRFLMVDLCGIPGSLLIQLAFHNAECERINNIFCTGFRFRGLASLFHYSSIVGTLSGI